MSVVSKQMNNPEKVRVAVIGATGFTGEKLIEILSFHPRVQLSYLTSRTEQPVSYSAIFPKFKNRCRLLCQQFDLVTALDTADFFFLALPHTVSMQFAPALLDGGKKVIDLSADYRLSRPSEFRRWYGMVHTDVKHLKKAVYGLSEIYHDKIQSSQLVANPGCYPTAVLLGLIPLVKNNLIDKEIIVDAKSAITGAGRKAHLSYHYANINGNIWAYKPFVHNHVSEILQELQLCSSGKIAMTFVPHVVGVAAGIYATIYVRFKRKVTAKKLISVYERFYKGAPFVRILASLPQLKDVVNTNFCDVGFSVALKGKSAVIAVAIDNLIKGAAGSAVQNMNIMCGWQETCGLLK